MPMSDDFFHTGLHVFKVRTPDGKGWLRTTRVYDDEAFNRVADMVNGALPLGIEAYHFHGLLNSLRFLSYPAVNLDIEKLFSSPDATTEQIRHRKDNTTRPIIRRYAQYAITRHPYFGWLNLHHIDGVHTQLIAPLETIPVSFKHARQFVKDHHRHCCPPQAHKFSVGLVVKGTAELIGVMVASTPKARVGYDSRTLEINRVCVFPPVQNGCSKLYGAAVRIGRIMGYQRFITYTLDNEDSVSVKAAGFTFCGFTAADKWDRPSRPRDNDKYPDGRRKRWMIGL